MIGPRRLHLPLSGDMDSSPVPVTSIADASRALRDVENLPHGTFWVMR